jgi:hypothetical protein
MDGAALVYEPTLESVLQKALEAKTKQELPLPARLSAPLSIVPPAAPSTTSRNVFAARGRFALQVAACLVLAVMTFVGFYVAPRLFQTQAQTSIAPIETGSTTDKPGTPTAEGGAPALNAGVPAEKPELENSKLEPSSLSDRQQTSHSNANVSFPALPGVKPLPRLKPLPTLKPLPRLPDQKRSLTPTRKTPVVQEKPNAKKDSRFGSFLKKTGRILTKPFKS